ncbi:hypothetical protein Mapa_010719 [Marchantia paleacea]|nr:hypothetical protein Mapa_010719 [Marchantia paleacea]
MHGGQLCNWGLSQIVPHHIKSIVFTRSRLKRRAKTNSSDETTPGRMQRSFQNLCPIPPSTVALPLALPQSGPDKSSTDA